MKERRETAGVILDAVMWSSFALQETDAETESDTTDERFERAGWRSFGSTQSLKMKFWRIKAEGRTAGFRAPDMHSL